MVTDTQKEQFAKLWDYEAELKRSNPNTTTEIVTIPQNGQQVFDKFYVCFENLRKTWINYCRPIIGLDGAFLKWELKGEILAAIGRDSDNRIYPVAWAVVRVEDNESWAWFIGKLREDLNLGLGNGFTLISDKQKGLINAVAQLLPNAEHRHCARHIYANWKKTDEKSDYKTFFWRIAYSYTVGEYEHNMAKLKRMAPKAYEELQRTDTKTWCRAFFTPIPKCADVTNNLSESFNRTITEARRLPLINMLEEIRRLAMKRNAKRTNVTAGCETEFPPHIMEIFEENRLASQCCTVIQSSSTMYEVVESDGSYLVDLAFKSCACNQWDLTGIPCRHAIQVITEQEHEPALYFDDYYFTSVWQNVYKHNILPVNGELLWPKTEKDPIGIPERRRMPGRPKKYKRIKEIQESATDPTKATRHGRVMTCSNCKGPGHNKSSCTGEPFVPQPSQPKKRGRLRKNPDDPCWTNENAQKRRKTTQSTPASQGLGTPTSQVGSTTASQGRTTATRGRGRGSVASRGRGTPTSQVQSTTASQGPTAATRGRGRGSVASRGRGTSSTRGRARRNRTPSTIGLGDIEDLTLI